MKLSSRTSYKKRLIDLCEENDDYKMKYMLQSVLNITSFEQGKLEVSFTEKSPDNFIENLVIKLKNWTGKDWKIIFSLGEYCENFDIDADLQAIRTIFPEAKIVCMRSVDNLK
ncbi:hypothetical protein [Candidatus Liberibacter brunswickensis]|uniref:hypothetical protein n=1 Tax=Candidatus Liberibacter brunswickensis TaxID=1968796 RepID=UPI002FE287E1